MKFNILEQTRMGIEADEFSYRHSSTNKYQIYLLVQMNIKIDFLVQICIKIDIIQKNLYDI